MQDNELEDAACLTIGPSSGRLDNIAGVTVLDRPPRRERRRPGTAAAKPGYLWHDGLEVESKVEWGVESKAKRIARLSTTRRALPRASSLANRDARPRNHNAAPEHADSAGKPMLTEGYEMDAEASADDVDVAETALARLMVQLWRARQPGPPAGAKTGAEFGAN